VAPPDFERPLLEVLGVTIHYLPDELAPPVDREKLAQYLRDELSPDQLPEVYRLIGSFRCWHEACAALLRDGQPPEATSRGEPDHSPNKY
jgi:hypothetical protein